MSATNDYQAQAAQTHPGLTPHNPAPSADPGRRLRVAVVGLGIGRMHIEGWRQHPQVDVVAIADADAARLEQVGEQFGIAARYASLSELLAAQNSLHKSAAPLDAVSICTPNAFHRELTLQALAAGCHVLCEKPMAMSAAEAREMLDAAEKAQRRLMINFSYRFSAATQAIKAQVDAGVFGDFYFGRTVWHRRRGMPGFGGWFGQKALAGGGPLIDLGVHRLDLALWLMGYPKPVWVMGSAYNPIAGPLAAASGQAFDVEDLAAGFIRFENGATLAIEASWAAHIREAELMETRLLGTKAGLLQRNLNETYQFQAEIFSDQHGSATDTLLRTPTGTALSAMHHYASAILSDTPHDADGHQGWVVMQILDALYASARSGAPVQITA
ncbi:Gfo/Idh/MocA family protein [Amphibiibacter pelophylacis]|uniref:Gfo/Idh/MocA family oxidoreductase n=1 Tax=Amphibiibacter pelophylacis TaxID=1799477 RepID=A0ACC6P253_9BURK